MWEVCFYILKEQVHKGVFKPCIPKTIIEHRVTTNKSFIAVPNEDFHRNHSLGGHLGTFACAHEKFIGQNIRRTYKHITIQILK